MDEEQSVVSRAEEIAAMRDLEEKDLDFLVRSVVPCACPKPLLGYWRDADRWHPRCRLCGTRFRSVMEE